MQDPDKVGKKSRLNQKRINTSNAHPHNAHNEQRKLVGKQRLTLMNNVND